jgi:hypothetical protein
MEQPVDKTRLVKLLGMTTSEHDGEALNAMRMANDLIKAAGKTWADVLATDNVVNIVLQRPAPKPYTTTEDWSPPHLTDKVLIDAMFRAIYAQPRSSNEEFWQWVDSVHQQWLDRGRLTPGQYQAVRRCYSRVMKQA